MKICFIDSYYKGLYGAPKSMLSLAKGLVDKGCDVTIASSKIDSLLNTAKKEHFNIKSFNTPSKLLESRKNINLFFRFIYVYILFKYWFKLLRENNLNDFDFICVNDIRSFLLFLPLIFSNKNKIIWYVRINDRVRVIHRIAGVLSRKIILISSDCINSFSYIEKKLFKNKFTVLNTGFKFDDFDIVDDKNLIIKHKESDVVFINVGSICERKNQIDTIKSFYRLDINNKYLYLVGSPTSEKDKEYYNKLCELISLLDLDEKISFIDHTPYVFSYLNKADFFLFSSHKEGLPRVVIEAVMAGCYIVSSKVDGISDIIKSNRHGVYTCLKSTDPNFLNEFSFLINESIDLVTDKNESKSYIEKTFEYELFVDRFIWILNN